MHKYTILNYFSIWYASLQLCGRRPNVQGKTGEGCQTIPYQTPNRQENAASCKAVSSVSLCDTSRDSTLSFRMAPRFSHALRSGHDPGHSEFPKKSISLTFRRCCVARALMQGALSWRNVVSSGHITFSGLFKNGIALSIKIVFLKYSPSHDCPFSFTTHIILP